MIVQLTLIWRHENIICNMASGTLSGQSFSMALNDDLSLTLTVYQVADNRLKIDCPINDPDAILQKMFSVRYISVNWTIMGHCSLCYLMNG